jgi:hypothetical protein
LDRFFPPQNVNADDEFLARRREDLHAARLGVSEIHVVRANEIRSQGLEAETKIEDSNDLLVPSADRSPTRLRVFAFGIQSASIRAIRGNRYWIAFFRGKTSIVPMKLLRCPALVGLLVVGAFLSGCSSLATHREPEIAKIKSIYVEHLLTDNYRTDQNIVAELQRLGYQASCGPLTMMPETGIDAVLSYKQRSQWDFRSYLIELSVEVKENFSGKTIATGHYYQPSLRTKNPEETVRAVIEPIFKKK